MKARLLDTTSDYLKFDPYDLDGEKPKRYKSIDVTREEFFEHIYSHPIDGKKYDAFYSNLKGCEINKIFFVVGYAGCGKSVLIQKVMYDLGLEHALSKNTFKIIDFEDAYGVGIEGIFEVLTRRLAGIITQDCISNKENFELLMSSLTNDYPAYSSLNVHPAVYDKMYEFATNRAIMATDFENKESLSEIICNTLIRLFVKSNEDIRNRLKGLIMLDCLWRKLMERQEGSSDSRSYIAYDNIDLIDGDTVALRNFIAEILRLIHDINNTQTFSRVFIDTHPFRFIVAMRKITQGLMQGVINEGGVSVESYHEYYDVSKCYSFSGIFNNRVNFLGLRHRQGCPIALKETDSLLDNIKLMTNTKIVDTEFSLIFNNNYRISIDTLISLRGEGVHDILSKLNADSILDKDRATTHSGKSSVLLHGVLKGFNDANLFKRLGLADLSRNITQKDFSNVPTRQLTSLARVLLTYLYNDKREKDSIGDDSGLYVKDIFDFFAGIYSSDDIVSVLSAFIDRNEKWRRLAYMKNLDLSKWETEQERKYLDVPTALRRMSNDYNMGSEKSRFSDVYAEIEISEAGKAYVDYISSHFELLAIRKGATKSLFSIINPADPIGNDKFPFEDIIDRTFEAVELCVSRLIEFNKRVMEEKEYDNHLEYCESKFIGYTKNERKQFHEERILFQHIYYIEDYRWVIVNKNEVKTKPDIRIRVNKILVKAIQRYLDLLESQKLKYLWTERREIKDSLIEKAMKISDSDYQDFVTRIQRE